MSHCPNCGAPGNRGETGCRRCGTRLVAADGGSAIDDGNENGPASGEHEGGGSEDAADESEAADDAAREAEPTTRGGGVSRRGMLLYSGGSAALTLATIGAGWFAFVYKPRPPEEEVVREYVDAIDRNKFNTATGLFHEESPHTPWPTRDPAEIARMDLTVESTSVDDRQVETERESVREYALVVTEVTFDSGAESERFTVRIVVAQNEDGEWRIWRDQSTTSS
jgi:hypothetical protein